MKKRDREGFWQILEEGFDPDDIHTDEFEILKYLKELGEAFQKKKDVKLVQGKDNPSKLPPSDICKTILWYFETRKPFIPPQVMSRLSISDARSGATAKLEPEFYQAIRKRDLALEDYQTLRFLFRFFYDLSLLCPDRKQGSNLIEG